MQYSISFEKLNDFIPINLLSMSNSEFKSFLTIIKTNIVFKYRNLIDSLISHSCPLLLFLAFFRHFDLKHLLKIELLLGF